MIEMLEINILGASDSVGKSCVLISDDENRKVILDAGIQLHPRRTGLVSTAPNVDQFAEETDAVLISHAHIDHSAYTPALYRAGYRGPTYMTHPTKDLVRVLWKDHLKIEGPHHYGVSHLQKALDMISPHYYGRKIRISDGVTAEFLDASHILGSALILLDWEGTRILYTGDFNDAKTPYHDPIKFPDPDDPIDILITETTNANRRIEGRKIAINKFTKSLLQCYSRGGKAIIPSFALGRSQEIQAYLMSDFDSFLYKFPLYIDGMILEMNSIYEKFMNSKWVSPRILIDLKDKGLKTPFDHNGIKIIDDVARKMKRSKKRDLLINQEQQSMILTTSGMMEGGPVYDYLRLGGNNPLNALLIVGYQVEGTLGSDIARGVKDVSLDNGFGRIDDVFLELEVTQFEFSGHASLDGLVQMVKYTSPKDIFAIHGEHNAQQRYADELGRIGFEPKTLTDHATLKY
jgi:predicted metal-dependent RNase